MRKRARESFAHLGPVPFINTHLPHFSRPLPSSHAYLGDKVGGRHFTLITAWEELVVAVQTVWTPPVDTDVPWEGVLSECPAWMRRAAETLDSRHRDHPPVPRSVDDFFQALRRCFDEQRSGVLVSIRRNKLDLFLPFANDVNYMNPNTIALDGMEGTSKREVSKYAQAKAGRMESGKSEEAVIIKDVSRWWLNGHVVCNVRPDNVWGDYQMAEVWTMLQKMLSSYESKVPDVDFIFNKRDCPMLVRGSTGSLPTLPVLSLYTGPAAFDVPCVLPEDWTIATDDAKTDPPDWSGREDGRIVFRGSSTGIGTTMDANERMATAKFCATNSPLYFDVKITRLNERDQVVERRGRRLLVGHPPTRELAHELRSLGALGGYMSLEDQAKRYRTALYIKGHQAASRLGKLFALGFLVVVLEQDGEEMETPGNQVWLHHALHPYPWRGSEEAIPRGNVLICRSNQELLECAKWISRNPDVARNVAATGYRTIGQRVLSVDTMLRWMHMAMCKIARLGATQASPTAPVQPHAFRFVHDTHPLYGATNVSYLTKPAYLAKL